MIFHMILLGLLYHFVIAVRPNSLIYADDNVQNYLMNFGYLPQSDLETGNLRTDDQLREAIRSLQNYGGIPETGEIDEATQKLMKSPRCGVADKIDPRYKRSRHKRFTIHGQPWPYKNLTWSLRGDAPTGLDKNRVRQELSRALDLWARNSKLTFQEVNSEHADILISFQSGYHGDGYPFDGRGQILAHAFFPGRDRGGDAHFDKEEIWLLQNDSNEEGTSLFAVAAHEFGHSLGLAHSSVRGALMYPWYQGISQNYELPEDDRNGIQQMYGAPEDRLWARIPDRFSPPTTTTTRAPRTRPTKRPYGPTRPNTYPDEPGRPGNRPHDRYPYKPGYRTEQSERPVWTERPWKPHRHHPVVTTTTTTIAPSTSHRPRHRWTPPPRNDIPDKCDTSYDAITHIRREIFIFKGRYLWRVGEQGPYEGYPVEITRLFNLPENIDHVDAVYERLDRKIVVFIGRNYYVFNAHELEPGYPRSLRTLGLPESLEKIDAAMVWGHNSKTYFFSGTMYWRFDESIKHVELDYPRDMSMFRGVDYNIDTVFQWKNGKTYFFKGKGFWEFNDMRMRVAHEKPRSSAQFWMGCPPEMETNDVDFPERRAKIINNTANKPTFRFSFIILLLIALSMRIT